MDAIVARDADLGRLAGSDGPCDQETVRILQLSSWMMILGTVRLLCAVGDYASAFLAMNGAAWPSFSVLARFLQENPLAILVAMGWPLIMGLTLRRSINRAYLGAAAITFFILSMGGILQLIEGLSLRSDPTLVVGSFTMSGPALVRQGAADLVRGSMGAVQLTLELATAVYAFSLAMRRSGRPVRESPAPDDARRRLRGRLAIYLSLAFLALSLRMPFWTAYVEVLNRSPLVRDFVLSTAPQVHRPRAGRFVMRPRQEMEREIAITGAARMASLNRIPEAVEGYRQIIALAESMGDGGQADGMKEQLARALNNLAWILSTCADASFLKPTEAVAYANRAVNIAPAEGTYWNTLGAAYFRVGDWDRARQAMHKSMELRGGQGDAFDWFFLAMINAKQGDQEHAREWYDKAVAWFHDGHEYDDELYRFQVEAADVLGLPSPSAPDTRKRRAGPVPDGNNTTLHRRVRPDPAVVN